jgi:sugar phosphate isomerase/epimerase
VTPFLLYVQIKDAVAATGEVVPTGQGDGQIRETLSALNESGLDGYQSLEPHLAAGETFGSFSGPAEFHRAAEALKDLVAGLSASWL